MALGLWACSSSNGGGGGGGDTAVDTGGDSRPDGASLDTQNPDVPIVQDTTPDQVTPDTQADTQSDAGQACGAVTFEGECDGTTVRWCQNNTLQEIDCATFFPDPIVGSCEQISTDYGYFCAAQGGDDCIFSDTSGNLNVGFCAGTEPGCVLTADSASCATSVGTCTTDDEGTCFGDSLVLQCNETQPFLADCTSAGGTCDTDSGACIGIGEGGPCDDTTFICDNGLSCEGMTDTAPGSCTSGGGDVSGDSDLDAGADVPIDEGTGEGTGDAG